MKCPNPAAIDELAQKHMDLEAEKKKAAAALKASVDKLAPIVLKFGSAHKDKSKLLRGILREIMVTIGSATAIDEASVMLFRLACVKAEVPKLFDKVFRKATRYELVPNSATIFSKANAGKRLRALYARCVTVTQKEPRVVARLAKRRSA